MTGKLTDRRAAANSTFAIGGVFPLMRDRLCFADSFVVTESSVLRMNICNSNPALRKAVEHYMQFYRTDRTDFNRRDFRNNYVYNLELLETIEQFIN